METAGEPLVRSRYQISILQAEFSLTQVLDCPLTGRVSRRTPGKFRTRVITDGVVPSLRVDYKNSRIKQYHKEGRALRAEATINNTRDFGIGELKNLPELRQVGCQAKRRLLDVQTVSHDCSIGEDAFEKGPSPRSSRTTGFGLTVRRCACAGIARRAGLVQFPTARFYQSGNASLPGSTAGPRPSQLLRGPNDL